MFQFHGWAVIESDVYASNDEADQTAAGLIESELTRLGIGYQGGGHVNKGLNGLNSVTVSGMFNHYSASVEEFFRFIGATAVGSYGILFLQNDEDKEYGNEWRVARMVRGRVSLEADPFLSPCIPTIEDPYDPDRPD
jgi:hypothetical protein